MKKQPSLDIPLLIKFRKKVLTVFKCYKMISKIQKKLKIYVTDINRIRLACD